MENSPNFHNSDVFKGLSEKEKKELLPFLKDDPELNALLSDPELEDWVCREENEEVDWKNKGKPGFLANELRALSMDMEHSFKSVSFFSDFNFSRNKVFGYFRLVSPFLNVAACFLIFMLLQANFALKKAVDLKTKSFSSPSIHTSPDLFLAYHDDWKTPAVTYFQEPKSTVVSLNSDLYYSEPEGQDFYRTSDSFLDLKKLAAENFSRKKNFQNKTLMQKVFLVADNKVH